MKKWVFFYLLLPFPIFTMLNDDGDFQIWNTNGIDIRLSPKSSFYGDMQFRYGDDASKLYYKRIHAELSWNLNRSVILAPAIRFIWLRMQDSWIKENAPLVKLTLFLLNSRQIEISHRSWIQYSSLPNESTRKRRFLYRTRLQFLFPWRMGHYQISPYVSDEIFWQEAHGVFENRLIIGLLIPRNQRAFFDLLYDYRTMKNLQGKWVQHNIFNAGVYFYF